MNSEHNTENDVELSYLKDKVERDHVRLRVVMGEKERLKEQVERHREELEIKSE